MPNKNWSAIFAAATLCIAVTGCTSTPAPSAAKALHISGIVKGGQQPVTGATIQLYAAGTSGDKSQATGLISSSITVTTSDGSNTINSNANVGNANNSLSAGSFTISNLFGCPTASSEVYLVATNGNPGLAAGTNNTSIAAMAALGPCGNLSSIPTIEINELTTVGSLAALAPYAAVSPNGYAYIGSGTGDLAAFQAAFTTAAEYTNIATGVVPGATLPSTSYASSYEIATLADIIASCINSTGLIQGQTTPCSSLLADTTPSSGTAPSDTMGAIINVVNNPTSDVCPIFNLGSPKSPYQPVLNACPTSWSLPISSVSVSVSGANSVYQGATAQYTANVTGISSGNTYSQNVTWYVNSIAGGNSTVGTISSSGLYTPPATIPSSAVTISATSALATGASGSTSVTVLPVTVAVSGASDVLFSQASQYSATVTGAAQTVTWQVNGVTGGSSAEGTITTGGLYTAPASTPSTPVTITATSTVVTSASGSTSITISPTALSYATGDSRTVTQPSYPTVCATITAQFTTSQRSSPPSSDDTSRIQTALSSAACKNTGKAVELSISGSNTAFYSEELNVTGEGLLIDSGVTLYGGATYDTQSELLNVTGTNSSVMGLGTIDGRGDLLATTPGQYTTRLVQTNSANNFIAYNITLTQAIYPNLYIQGGNGATVWGVTILTPATRANADGIDIDSITNVTVTNSTIEAGDDGIAVKTNEAAASNITVSNNKLYGTHGLSIGSQTFNGVTNVLFTGNYVYGNDLLGNASTDPNGVNIKTDASCGGTVQQVTYRNTCMTALKHLIILNTYYGSCSGTTGTPVFENVIVDGAYATSSISGAYSQVTGYNSSNPSNAALANIQLDKNTLGTTSGGSTPTVSQYATVSLQNSTLTPTGTGITTNTFSTPGSVPSCSF